MSLSPCGNKNVFKRACACSGAHDCRAAHRQPTTRAPSLAACADVVFTIVGFPSDVREVILGEEGVLAGLRPGGVIVDMTTSEPSLAIEIARAAAGKGVSALDAPVSGGDIGAREARLSIMVGGDMAAFERVLPLFECMGKNIRYMGAAGAGQ
ncbi:NAD(P)-dependent oxidoreductase, partial [archaeon]